VGPSSLFSQTTEPPCPRELHPLTFPRTMDTGFVFGGSCAGALKAAAGDDLSAGPSANRSRLQDVSKIQVA
jgi:hypothetical protein